MVGQVFSWSGLYHESLWLFCLVCHQEGDQPVTPQYHGHDGQYEVASKVAVKPFSRLTVIYWITLQVKHISNFFYWISKFFFIYVNDLAQFL